MIFICKIFSCANAGISCLNAIVKRPISGKMKVDK